MNGTAVVEEPVAPEIAKDLEPFRQEVALFEERAKTLVVNDEITEIVATEFIVGCKKLQDHMEQKRDEKVRPLNEIVTKTNKAYKPYDTILDRLWRRVDALKSVYKDEQQRLIDEANRKELARVEQEKREKEEKEEKARLEAQRLREEAERIEREENDRLLKAEMDKLAAEKKIRDEEEAVREAKRKGDAAAAAAAQKLVDDAKREEEERAAKAEQDRLAALEEQHKLEKKAIQQDAKADIAAAQATMIAPTIHVNESAGKVVLSDGSTAGSRKVVDWHFKNGMPKDADYYFDDPRVQNIPARYFILDTKKLGKDVKNGVPVDGTLRMKGSATTAGRK